MHNDDVDTGRWIGEKIGNNGVHASGREREKFHLYDPTVLSDVLVHCRNVGTKKQYCRTLEIDNHIFTARFPCHSAWPGLGIINRYAFL